MQPLFFDDWESLLRTAISGFLAYFALVLFLRVAGKRTLSKMNAFDFVVTIAIGSTLATILLNQDVTVAEGAVAFAMLIGLQFVITWTSVRIPQVKKVTTGQPSLVLYEGRCLPDALHRERVTMPDVLAALRQAGLTSMSDARAVVLETDGSFSVIRNGGTTGESSMKDVIVPGRKGDDAATGA